MSKIIFENPVFAYSHLLQNVGLLHPTTMEASMNP